MTEPTWKDELLQRWWDIQTGDNHREAVVNQVDLDCCGIENATPAAVLAILGRVGVERFSFRVASRQLGDLIDAELARGRRARGVARQWADISDDDNRDGARHVARLILEAFDGE